MRKKVLSMLFTIILCLCVANVVLAEEQSGVEGTINFQMETQTLEFKGYSVGTDFEGKPALILIFDYSNLSDEGNFAASDFYIQVFQNGVERDHATLDFDGEWGEAQKNYTTDIKDGAKLTVCVGYLLDDVTSPVDIEAKEFVNWEGEQEMTIDISQFSGEIPAIGSTSEEDATDWETMYNDLKADYDVLKANYDSLAAEFEEYKNNSSENAETEYEQASVDNVISTMDRLQSELSGIEKNTNDVLDKVIEIAKADANTVTDEQITEAISAIRDNYPQYYNGPEQMELYMYYGYLLDYAFDDSDPRSELGMDTYQAIKYVYRNVETVLDSSTKENLNQIEKDLQYIN